MIPSSRRAISPRRLIAVAAIAAVPAVTGCAGVNVSTLGWHPATPGAFGTVGGIQLENVYLVGAPPNAQVPTSGAAGLFMALYNAGSGPDTLLGISTPGPGEQGAVDGPSTGIRVGGGQVRSLEGPKPVVWLAHLTEPLRGGTTVKMVFAFRNAGSITLMVPVMPRADDYSSLAPPPSPTPSPTATTSHRKREAAHHRPGVAPTPGTSGSGTSGSSGATPATSPTP